MSHTKKQTVLVTGAAGFIGSQFIRSCNDRGIHVLAVDHLAHFQTRKEHQEIVFRQVVDRAELLNHLDANPSPLGNDIQAIVHLGAITDTRETDIDRLNQWNLEYSKHLWKTATLHQIPFIYASSAATYGDGALGYDDQESLIPSLKSLNLYGESKQNFDLWVLGQEKTPPFWAGFKFFNVYGPGERHKGFMSSVVLHSFDQIQKNGQVTLFKSHKEGIADGFQKRDFIFVKDVIKVIHHVIDHPIQSGIYNLGTGQARAFLELAQAVFAALGKPEKIQFIDTPLEIRDKYQYFTEAKMDKLRGQGYSQPFTSLEDGVRATLKELQGASPNLV